MAGDFHAVRIYLPDHGVTHPYPDAKYNTRRFAEFLAEADPVDPPDFPEHHKMQVEPQQKGAFERLHMVEAKRKSGEL